MTQPVAEVTDLRIVRRTRERDLTLIDRMSFAVAAGEILGVVGETGAGKTLASKALIGLVPRGLRAEGASRIVDVRIDLREATARSARSRRQPLAAKCAMVMQNPATMLDPLVRVGPQLTEAVVWHGLLRPDVARGRARGLLTDLGFSDPDAVMGLYPHQLSGGMAQRAAIAMALMTRPAVLVVDEPTSALDANVRIEVLELLRRTARELSTAVLLVSHDLPLIGRFASRMIVVYAGRIVEAGPTSRVLDDPRHPYTQALLSAVPTVRSQPRVPLPTVPGSPPLPGAWPAGCVYRPRCPHAIDRCATERPPLIGEGDARAACFVRPRMTVLPESG